MASDTDWRVSNVSPWIQWTARFDFIIEDEYDDVMLVFMIFLCTTPETTRTGSYVCFDKQCRFWTLCQTLARGKSQDQHYQHLCGRRWTAGQTPSVKYREVRWSSKYLKLCQLLPARDHHSRVSRETERESALIWEHVCLSIARLNATWIG